MYNPKKIYLFKNQNLFKYYNIIINKKMKKNNKYILYFYI